MEHRDGCRSARWSEKPLDRLRIIEGSEQMRKPTIYEALKAKLGREPSNAELKAEVKRILHDGYMQGVASRG